MKQVMEHYAGAVIAVLLSLTVISFFNVPIFENNQSFSDVLGTAIESTVENPDYKEKTGNAFAEYMDATVPIVSVLDSYACVTGRAIPVSICLEARLGDESVELLALESLDEHFVTSKVLQTYGGTHLRLRQTGKAWVRCSVLDTNGNSHEKMAKLFVNVR